jgi:hypothetical protein
MENGPDAAAEKEAQQLINIATAASRISSLEHLILHTLPAGEKLSGKGNFVPHMDASHDLQVKQTPSLILTHLHRVKTKPRMS